MRADEWNNTTAREVERASIRAFVSSCAEQLGGRVLDYGCGAQPYRDVVKRAGGEYVGYDRVDLPGNVSAVDVGDQPAGGDWYDALLCTQVAMYWPDPLHELAAVIRHLIRPGGSLVLTYATTWTEFDDLELWRFTRAGMNRLLDLAGFEVLRHEERGPGIQLGGFHLALGYGVLARA